MTTLQFENELTVVNPRTSARVDTVARLFFASFWCIVFTGALRKWLFPHNPVFYLTQDVPIFVTYLYAAWTGAFTRGYLFLGMMLLSLILTLQGLLQVIMLGLSPLVALVGLHHYLFYLPMLLIFPLGLTEAYRRKFIRWNLWFSLPMCVLALAQSHAPTTAWVNQTSEGEGFGLPGVEIARVSGTFNFVAFYGIWVGTATALCLGEWLLPRHRRALRNQWLLALCTFATSLCYLVSGSRQTIFLCMAALAGSFIAAIVLQSTRAIAAVGGICLLLPFAVVTTYVISPVEFNTVKDRLSGEGAANSQGRIVSGFYAFLTEPAFSMVGAGLGLGVDASHVGDVRSDQSVYQLSEGDTIRNVQELGTPVGLFYLLMRASFLIGLILLAILVVRAGSAPHVLPLALLMFAQGWSGDMTRNATMTTTQIMIGCAFILGAWMNPDPQADETPVFEYSTRSA